MFRTFARGICKKFGRVPTVLHALEMCNTLGKMSSSVSQIAQVVYRSYVSRTPKTVKVIDVYLAFTAAVALLQFLYCSLVGTFPFNSFLAGFGCALGAFVLGGM
jgi:DAD family